MNKEALVSVIIPTFNRPDYLEEAIESVEKQTYSSIEIIVVDDGSEKPYAKAICEKFKNCHYYFKENGGLSSARNFGVNLARGNYIAFLDDDDRWKEDKLEIQVSVLQAAPKVDCVHSAAVVIDETGNNTGEIIGASRNKAHKRSGYVFWNALGVWVVKSPTPLIRKEVFDAGLKFDETIKVGEDIDFYQRLFFRHEIHYIQEPLAEYRIYEAANRLSKKRAAYLGIGLKMMDNFKAMGVRNKWVLHRIASRLVTMEVRNHRLAYPEKSLQFSSFEKFAFPNRCLRKIANIKSNA
ncbi:glycosyltransferase family 2 protein [Luteirhabdus pelagi]|uniref:glycosyltransferase family 2 protein n=1 Tax=Luteirhabdus pelagi TaxID=2792783 RepID=UPI0019398287|nr:glycosyltransferase family A protein [Luteirhabdus pelagi]